MHELSLCNSIADIVGKHAADRRVETIHLQVGRLHQVVPDTLVYCWGLVTERTPLAGSVLAVEQVAARLRCDACGEEREMGAQPMFGCPECHSTVVTVVAGEEFLITSMDVADVG